MKNLKKQTNFSSKVVPVGLDFIVAKNIAMVVIRTSQGFCKITPIKNY